MAATRRPKKGKPAPERDESRDEAREKAIDPRWQAGVQFWYKAEPGADVHEKLVQYGTKLRGLYSAAHQRERVHERLYEGTELRRNQGALRELQSRGFTAARLNVSKSVVNTMAARLSKDRPMPSFVVNDADWSLKRKARQFRKFILGEMLATEFDSLSKEALLDGGIHGNGITCIDDTGDGDKVFAERVLREELLFDPRECKYGRPPNVIRVYRVARDKLLELYPDKARQIIDAPASTKRAAEELDDETTMTDLEDYVDVWRAHHVACRAGADDGREALVIHGATLKYDVWDSPRWPYAIYKYARPRRGIWSKGLIFELKDIQHRINCIVRDLQMNLQATGRGFFLQQEGTDLPIEMLTGWAPFSMKYRGNRPPTWQAPQPFNMAQLNALEFFIQQAYELTGVSQAAAHAKPQLGPGASGVAIDTQYDIDAERLAMEEGQYAEYRMDASQLYLDASKRVAKVRVANKGKKSSSVYVKPYTSSWIRRDAIEQLEHDEVSLTEDQYKLQMEPVNYQPDTRAGKLSEVGQLAQAGIIPQWLVAALFNEPDLARMSRITLGAFWNCERKMELLADETKPAPIPYAYNDLELELKFVVAYLNYSESENAPDGVLQRYRDYMDAVQDLIDKKKQGEAQQAALAGQGMGGGPAQMPGAAPMVPPGAPMPAAAGGAPALTAIPGGMAG